MLTSSLRIIAVSIFFIPLLLGAQEAKKEITLDDIWKKGTFRSDRLEQIRSMKDGLHYTVLEDDRGLQVINKYSYKTGDKVSTIASNADMIPEGSKEPIGIEEYSFSPDESLLLIATEVEKIYRHSTKETNYIYELKTKKLELLSPAFKQRYATFSPAGDKVAFVRTNNIYYKNLNNGLEVQVTGDGMINNIINGATDWVYEEEFGFDKAFFWSPDGKKIAFYQFIESKVKEFNMATYGNLYPKDNRFKYPKAGEVNALVSIHVYELESTNSRFIELEKEYEYIPRIKWTKDPNQLCVYKMNRHQNKLDLTLLNTITFTQFPLLSETSTTWIDIDDDQTFLKDKQHFIWTSEKDGFKHIYLYNIRGKLVRQITKGKWDVVNFEGIDENKGILYYTSVEESPLGRQLYSIKLSGSGKKRLTKKKGSNRANFSSGFQYYINSHTDANSPTYITLNNASGKEIRALVENDKLNKRLAQYDIAKKEFFDFTTSEGVKLNGWMIKPTNFDKSKKYPLFMFVYGGPGSQTVRDSWDRNLMWYQMLAQKGYIIASVDNRGTGSRGQAFKNCTYKELGKLETMDQIEAAKYLGGESYIDADRIGIWGWSYGGYMSSLCLSKGADLFKMAMAVAPVTNWRYYDSIYTERYMQTPQENASGYDDNSPINHVDKIKGKYLLVHGMADDNVHFQNSVEMVNALIDADVHFDLYMYPDRNHSIYGGNARYHLFTKLTNFILENL